MSQLPFNPNMPPMPPPPMRGMPQDGVYNTGYDGYPPQGGGYPIQGGQPPSYPGGGGGYPPAQPQMPPGYGFAPAYPNPTPSAFPAEPAYNHATGPTYDYGKMEDGSNGAGVRVGEDESTGFGASFSDKAIRRAFIKKVYLILSTQLLVTTGFIALFVLHDGVKSFVRKNIWTYYLGFGVFIVTYITLICCPSVRRKYPGNVIALTVFTLAMSYMVAVISSFHQTRIVLMAGGTCAVVCFAVSIFAMQTKFDFTMCSGFLVVASVIMFIFGIMMIFFRDNGPLNIVYSALSALLFTLFLGYDTQMVMGGKRMELSAEEYILGALQLYLDIVYIFIHLLSLFNRAG